jgi:Peptidase family M28
MKKNLLVLFLMVTFALSAAGQTVTKKGSPAMKAAEAITAEQLKDYLYFIADDAMQGRDTPSAGLDVAANFIAFHLKKWGVKPAGDNGTYFQRMWVVRKATDSAASSAEINGQKLVYGDEFFAEANAGTANAPLVFGGNGWMHKAKGIDAFAGVEVKGKIVVIYANSQQGGLPAGLTFADLQNGEQGADWADPRTYAAMKGAAGLIMVATPAMQTNWARTRQQRERTGMAIEKLNDGGNNTPVPVIYVSQKIGNALFEGESANPYSAADVKAFDFSAGKKINFAAAAKVERVPTQNVIGMIEGSDPVLKSEMIVNSAHYDHVGVNPNLTSEDKIFNGADDDGSGTVAILGMAEALAKSPKKPKRSVMFLWVAGEEKGLLGSEYFAKYPTVPLKNIVTNINIDMIGRSRKADNTDSRDKDLAGENEMYVIGSNMMSSTLGKVTETVNKTYLNMTYNFKYDDPKDTNRFFFRSDHYHFAVNGVPAVFFFNGVHRDYHQIGDHPDKIDYIRMQKITRTIFLTMWELGDLKERPKVDKELPPELKSR